VNWERANVLQADIGNSLNPRGLLNTVKQRTRHAWKAGG